MKVHLVKIGGDLLADKLQVGSVNLAATERLCREFSNAVRSAEDVRMVLVHGTGGFGHTVARRWQVELNSGNAALVCEAAHAVRGSVLDLHSHVLETLRAKNLLLCSFSPYQFFTRGVDGSYRVSALSVEAAIRSGYVPVLHGDMVYDEREVMSICSSETVIVELAKAIREVDTEMQVEKVIVACGLEGVLLNVEEPGSGIFKVIDSSNIESVHASLRDHDGVDVTGGMRHKVQRALELARMGVETLIVNGGEQGRLEAALKGEDVVGTLVRAM
jgi:isopentenyl phosphate kinase